MILNPQEKKPRCDWAQVLAFRCLQLEFRWIFQTNDSCHFSFETMAFLAHLGVESSMNPGGESLCSKKSDVSDVSH